MIYKKILCGLCAIFGLTAMSSEPMVLLDEATMEFKEERCIEFKPDFSGEHYYLQLDARLENETRQRIGSWFALRIELNGTILDFERLRNYRGGDYTANSGLKYPIYSRAHNIFRVPYSPDFQPFPEESLLSMPVQLGNYPYRFIIDVSDLVKSGEINKLVLANRMTIAGFPVFLQAVKLTDSYEAVDWSLIPPEPDMSPLAGIIGPRLNWEMPIEYRSGEKGELFINGYRLETTCTIPESKWVSGKELSNRYYKFHREITSLENALQIRDTITNRTDSPLGLMIKYRIDGKKTKVDSLRLNGFLQIGRKGLRNEQILNAENPSVYVNSGNGGLGLLAVDDALRANLVTFGIADNEYGMMNRRLVIDPGKSYTTSIEVYPTATADYFDFVNAARRKWEVNFQLDNLVFAHGFSNHAAKRKDADFADFIRLHKPHYIGLDTQTRIAPEGGQVPERSLEDYVWGSPLLLTERFEPLRNTTLLLRDRFLAADPEAKIIAYHNSYLIPSPDTATRYPDELWRDRSGEPATYSRVKAQRILPNEFNQTGQAQFEVFDKFFVANRMGIFWDESIGVDPLYSFKTPWDGYSGELDPKTFKLLEKVSNIILFSQNYQKAVIKKFRDADLPVVCNFEPGTWAVAKCDNILRFVEGHDPLSGNRTHFYTPVAWGAADIELTENDIAKTMRTHLANGALFMYYSRKFEHDNNFIQEFYPITPLELHSGYVIGKEKIITMRSGTFSWNDKAALEAVIFDKNGFKCRTVAGISADDGISRIVVTLENDEVAVIKRETQP